MTIEKLPETTPDITRQNVARLAELFPECVTEGPAGSASDRAEPVVDFDLLRQALSDHLIEGPQERYRLDWPGKREALLTANTPIDKTLRPMRNESVDFDTTRNLFIEGDNLEALKLLQETFLGKVKLIYIDPPYNTGNDFIYDDNYVRSSESYEEISGIRDQDRGRLIANPETNGRFHSDWLSMIYPRLKLSRNLLSEDGVLLTSIGEKEISSLCRVIDEIFGSSSVVGIISRVMKSGGAKGTFFTPNVDYIVCCVKNPEKAKPFRIAIGEDQIKSYYNKIEKKGPRAGDRYGEERLYLPSLNVRPNQRYYIECPDGTFVIPPGSSFPDQVVDGAKVLPGKQDGVWRWTYETYKAAKTEGRIIFKETDTSALINADGSQSKFNIYFKLWLKDQQEKGKVPPTFLPGFENRRASKDLSNLHIPFDYAKPVELLEYLIGMVRPDDGDLVMDFFAGSGSFAHAVMAWSITTGNTLRSISVQLPEETPDAPGFTNIAELARERIRRAGRKLLSQKVGETKPVDVGFRAFRIDDGNNIDVLVAPQHASQDALAGMISHIKDDRTDEDLLFGALLRWGVDITLPVRRGELVGRRVWFVDPPSEGERGAAVIACFARPQSGKGGIDTDLADAIADLKPLRVLFRDDGFANDSVKENVASRFKQASPDTTLRVL